METFLVLEIVQTMSSTLKTISGCTYSNCGMIHVSPEFLKDDAQTLGVIQVLRNADGGGGGGV